MKACGVTQILGAECRIEAQDRYKEENLHYSSVVSASESDLKTIRELMAQTIEKIRAIVRSSKDEKCFSYAMDLFEVGRPVKK